MLSLSFLLVKYHNLPKYVPIPYGSPYLKEGRLLWSVSFSHIRDGWSEWIAQNLN